MLQDCKPGKQPTPLVCEGSGQSCAIVVTQPGGGASGGWVFELQVETEDRGLFVVRRKTLTNALRARSRVLFTATVPGALRWLGIAYPPTNAVGVRAALVASDLPFANDDDQQVGQPGSKGWSYAITAVVNVPPGALVKEISAVGGGGPGTCQITVPRDATSTDALAAIPIAAAEDFVFPKETCEGLVGPVTVTFTGTARQTVVWLE